MFARQDHDDHRRLRRAAAAAVGAAAVILPLFAAASAQAAPMTTPTFTSLTLVNGWTKYDSTVATPAVTSISGIVHLKGAIKTKGVNPVAFTLPAGDRPATRVFVPVDMCDATNGRLDIRPSGQVTVEAEAFVWKNAQCFTSLDGVTFATSASSFTPLTLVNGWTSYGAGTASPAARVISGIIHLEGAIKTNGSNAVAATLPAGDRPARPVRIPADMCNATNGQLYIFPSGVVQVAPDLSFTDATCFTSLDGVSFATSASSFIPLTLENGWKSFGFGFSGPAVRVVSGIVQLEGVIQTSDVNPVAFTLPAADRPAHDVYVKVPVGDDPPTHNNGRLHISPSGSVTVQVEGENLAPAMAFTSLDDVSFAR